MKTFLTTAFAILLFSVTCSAQNTFPATGSVGIGTTTPTLGTLQINGTNDLLSLYSTATGVAQFNAYNNTDFRIIQRMNAPMTFWTNTNERMRIDQSGNVGVGTYSPSEKLEVSGGYVKSGLVSIGSNSQVGAKNYINLGADFNGSFLVGSNIYVTSQGGTTALKIANTHATMAGAGIVIPGNGQNFQSSIMFHTSVPGAVVADASYNSCRMIINEHGKVGIGTTSPDQLLTVNGTVHSKAVVVDNSIFPDYVFNKTYALRPLSAVKTYIDLNHHLPEMPSAAEVAKNGQNLGEINALLLKKVEELTLYMIELNKTVKAQQQEIETLKNKN